MMTNFGQLPAELLSLILHHVDKRDLYAYTLVNHQFYNSAMPLLWHDMAMDSNDMLTKITSAMATSSFSPGDHIRHVSMAVHHLSDTSLLAFIQHVPGLTSLRLEKGDNVTDTSFQHLPTHCPHLTGLYIAHADGITQSSMVALGQHCRHLATLELEWCHGVDTDLFHAVRDCPLQQLPITRCHLDNMKDQGGLAQQAALMVAGFHQLTLIRIQDFTNNYSTWTTMVWPHLTHLCLDACIDMDDAMAIGLMQHHSQLTHLELRTSEWITNRTLDAIPVWLPDVKQVVMHSFPQLTAAGICRLVKQCRTLDDGVSCAGCRIYPRDPDFPEDLDPAFYYVEWDEDDGYELWWIAGNAFDGGLMDDDNNNNSTLAT